MPVDVAPVAQIAARPLLMRERGIERDGVGERERERLGKRERETGRETAGLREEALLEVSLEKMASA